MTGAGGFIGRHVTSDLLRRGHEVRAITRSTSAFQAGVKVYRTSRLDDVAPLRLAFSGAASVVHLAGHAHAMSPDDGKELYRAVNVDGTRAVADAAAAESVGQFVFASSVKVIGEGGDAALTDDTAAHPVDAYGRSKLEAENTLYDVRERAGLPITVLRFPLVYGPGVKGNIRRLFDAVWRGFPLPVGGVHNERTMLGIDNLTAFLIAIIETPVAARTPLLVSDAEATSTESLARMIGKALGKPARIVNVPPAILRALGDLGDVASKLGVNVFSTAAADRLLGSLRVDSARGWQLAGLSPPVRLEEGIKRVGEWYRAIRR